MARDDDDDDDRPRKKKTRPSEEIEDDDRPVRKRRPVDDDEDEDRIAKKRRPHDDDDDDDRPRKRRRMDADDEDEDDLGNSPLGAVVPLGTSVWALLALYSALLSCVVPGLGLLSIIFGVVAIMQNKHKATYGSVTGNIRAVLGIVLGLGTLIVHIIALIAFLAAKR